MLIRLIGPEWRMVAVWGSAYAGTGVTLLVLFLSAPLVFIKLVGVIVANAMGQERRLIWLMGFATVCNVDNVIAMPWGTRRAAGMTLITQILTLAGLAMTVRQAAFAPVASAKSS
jgi:hypothetical protein